MPVKRSSSQGRISAVHAREVIDSRGYPTLEAEVVLAGGARASAIVPSGASTGEREALELRDASCARYAGKGVLKAKENVLRLIAPCLKGRDVFDQRGLDRLMIELDGTPNKSRLGANAILGVSMALAKAAARAKGVALYRYLGGAKADLLPVPCMNVINGGRHADNNLDFQEFMVVPHGADSFSESLRMGLETFHALRGLLRKKGLETAVGDEGGFAPSLESHEEAVELILEAARLAGLKPGKDVSLALDPATSELYEGGSYHFRKSKKPSLSTEDMIRLWQKWIRDYPVISIEDALAENDWQGWKDFTRASGREVELVGDDLFCTNPAIIERGIKENVANSVLIKLNQIGTLTETLEAVRLAKKAGYGVFVSHRSGESEDTTIADLAVAVGSGKIKTGSGCRSDRTAKYNQLLRIEEDLGSRARFIGRAAFSAGR